MPSSEDPPLSEYQQTVQDFIALLQALRAWRKVIHLYYQGHIIGRLTVNFAELMKKSSSPRITLVDHFDDDPNIAVWHKANAPPAQAATAPVPVGDYSERPAAAPVPQIIYRAFPPHPAKPIPQPDWTAIFEQPLDFSALGAPVRDAPTPDEVNAGLTALTRNLARALPATPVRQADMADLFGPRPPADAVIAPISIPAKPAEESAAPPAGDSLENEINAQADQVTQQIVAQGQADAAARSAAIARQFAQTEAALNAPIPSVFAVAPLKFGQGYDSLLGTSLNVSGAPANVGGDDFIAYATYRPYPGLGVSGVVADDKGNAVVASGVFSGDKDADGHYILTPATPEQRAAIAVANASAVPAITKREIAVKAGLELGGMALPALGNLAASVSRGVRAAITADEALALPKPTGVTAAPVMPEAIAAGNVPEPGAPQPTASAEPITELPPEPSASHLEDASPEVRNVDPPPPDNSKGATDEADSDIPETAQRPKDTGTVWDSIRKTQDVYPGTKIPRSFILSTNHADVRVTPNAPEHLAEYALSNLKRGVSQELVDIGTQSQLTSLKIAVARATSNGVPYGTVVNESGWELIFSPGRQPDRLPALIHALQRQ
jgi:filamentous hemagglutinin